MVVSMASDVRVQNFGGWVLTIQTEGCFPSRYYYFMVITSNGTAHFVSLKRTVAVLSHPLLPCQPAVTVEGKDGAALQQTCINL